MSTVTVTTGVTTAGLLQDKIVLVTGASSGIGAESARLFGRGGAAVVLAGLDDERLAGVATAVLVAGGRAEWVHADVSRAADVGRLVDGILERRGRLDGAFNNAGLSLRSVQSRGAMHRVGIKTV